MSKSQPDTFTFHLLPNAHLDPVWLWDWREGLNEGLITTRTVLNLMDEFPELTFMRGEAALYQHIEEHDPETFERVKAMIATGRWDVVGGTFIQPDTNMPATETLLRHFAVGQAYFKDRFGLTPRAAWAADSFGHSAGLPEILDAAGMDSFSFSRPAQAQMHLAKPAFWWEAASGARILCYRVPVGWYGSERHDVSKKLDESLALARQCGLHNVGVYMGLGNHGGGPTRRQILDALTWAKAHPEVTVQFSTLHRLMEAMRSEASQQENNFLPTVRGELGHCLRGCYASLLNFKTLYRKAEVLVNRAERVDSLVSARLARSPAKLNSAWESVLFNSFHDILPGSSIERAFDEQREWLGVALHESRRAEQSALNALTAQIDTSVPPPPDDHPSAVVLAVFNPHPHEYRGPIELEASLDYRPVWAYLKRAAELPVEVRGPDRQPLPFQMIATEHSSMPDLPWRKRVLLPVTLPPCGWSVFEMQWLEAAQRPQSTSSVSSNKNSIENGIYTVSASKDDGGVKILHQGKPVFDVSGLHCMTVDDPWGSWGNMDEIPADMNLSTVRHAWKVTGVETLEHGPERATLWVRMEGGASRLDLSFSLYRDRDAVNVSTRLFWNERSARLKMVMPVNAASAEYEVPGGIAHRGSMGEVAGGRWVRTGADAKGDTPFGFASDALYCFDLTDGALRATLVRASRYANDVKTAPEVELWRPATDVGEHRFNFVITSGTLGNAEIHRLAAELEMPPIVVTAAPHPGSLPRLGSLAALTTAGFNLLAIKPATNGEGWVLRLQETAGTGGCPSLNWMSQELSLDALKKHQIGTWRLKTDGKKWQAERLLVTEQS